MSEEQRELIKNRFSKGFDIDWMEDEKEFIQFVFLDNMRGKDFSRIDLAFDLSIDLSSFYVTSDKALKKTVFYGRNDKPEKNILVFEIVKDISEFIIKNCNWAKLKNKKLMMSIYGELNLN